jgi:DNA repair photolyase
MPFDWSLNPLKGCAHACRYCVARAYHGRMDRDVGFDAEIDVQTNFVELLNAELRRRPKGSVAIGTATDPYQPIEGKYKLTGGCLEALVRYAMPTSIIAKGTLVVRDIDLF